MYDHAESLIDEWTSWGIAISERPQIVAPALHSETNTVFHIKSGKKDFALRLFSEIHSRDVDRAREIQIHRYVTSIGLSPRINYCDPLYRYAVITWIETGDPKLRAEGASAEVLDCIYKYQTSDTSALDLQPYSYAKRLEGYVQSALNNRQMQISSSKDFKKEGAQAVAQIESFEAEFGGSRCLTHNDLNIHNILWPVNRSDFACQIIDWEFAGLGIASFDLASCIMELSLAIDCTEVEAHREKLEISRDELEIALQCYGVICNYYRFAFDTN